MDQLKQFYFSSFYVVTLCAFFLGNQHIDADPNLANSGVEVDFQGILQSLNH